MVTHDGYNGLFGRTRNLEMGMGTATGVDSEEGAFARDSAVDEHVGDTDDDGNESDYGYFDGAENSLTSGVEQDKRRPLRRLHYIIQALKCGSACLPDQYRLVNATSIFFEDEERVDVNYLTGSLDADIT